MGIVRGDQTELSVFTFVTTECAVGNEGFQQTVKANNRSSLETQRLDLQFYRSTCVGAELQRRKQGTAFRDIKTLTLILRF
jgi:hypothetical protein